MRYTEFSLVAYASDGELSYLIHVHDMAIELPTFGRRARNQFSKQMCSQICWKAIVVSITRFVIKLFNMNLISCFSITLWAHFFGKIDLLVVISLLCVVGDCLYDIKVIFYVVRDAAIELPTWHGAQWWQYSDIYFEFRIT